MPPVCYIEDVNDMNVQKIGFSFGMILLIIIAISVLWQQVYVLSLLMLVFAYARHKVYPIKHEWLWFVVIGFIGPLTESIIMKTSGAWAYSTIQVFNFPLWLPFLYGLAGSICITLYEGISRK